MVWQLHDLVEAHGIPYHGGAERAGETDNTTLGRIRIAGVPDALGCFHTAPSVNCGSD